MKNKNNLIIPLLGIFFIGFFIPNELFKSFSYLGIAIFFLLSMPKSTFEWSNILSWRTIGLSIFFLLHLIGFLYSEDLKVAGRITILRIPLLFVPIFLYYSRYLGQSQKQKIELTFAFVCLLAGTIGLVYRIYYVTKVDPDTVWLYNDNLTSIFKVQAAYFGIYLSIAALFLTKALFVGSIIKKWMLIVSLLLITLFVFLLASRTALISFLALNMLNILYHGIKLGNKAVIRSFISGGILLLGALVYFFPKTINRFKSMGNIEYNFENESDYYHFGETEVGNQWNGLNSRAALWTAATKATKGHSIFGVGTGDLEQTLRNTYEELNFKLALERNFGPHNQYLEILVMFGFVGLFIFLFALFSPLVIYFKSQNVLGILIIICFAIAFLTEDFLNRNQGVVIFSFFYAYWPSSINEEKESL